MGRWFFGCPAYLSGPGKDDFRIDVSMASQSYLSRSLPAASWSRNKLWPDQTKEVRWGRSLHAWACRWRSSVSYPSLRSRRIAGTVKGVTKILNCICAPCASVDLAQCLKLLLFDFVLLLLMKKRWSWSYILCRRLRFELRSVDRLSLAHPGVDEWLLIPWVSEIPPKLPN